MRINGNEANILRDILRPMKCFYLIGRDGKRNPTIIQIKRGDGQALQRAGNLIGWFFIKNIQ